MNDSLLLRFEADTDGTGELFAEVRSNGFAGNGSAWFGEDQLIEFAKTLAAAYPLAINSPLKLEGGFFGKTGAGLEHVHLGLKFYPIGGTGQIGCRVLLNSPLYEHDRPDSQTSLAVELCTTYEQIGTFARSLEMLAKGSTNEAVLQTGG